MYKKLLCVCFLMCLVLCGCGKKDKTPDLLKVIKKRDKIIVGVRNDVKPFGFINKYGQHEGYDIDLARDIADAILGNPGKIEFVPVNAANRIMKLNSGEVDMIIATMSVTNQRLMLVDFSTPYYIAGQAVMVPLGSKVSSLMDLQDKKVIIVYGSTGERSVRMTIPNVTVYGYKSYPEAFRALKSGKADAMIADDTVLMSLASDDNSMTILPRRYSKEPYAIALRKGEESQALLKRINFELDILLRTGDLYKLQEKWNIRNLNNEMMKDNKPVKR